MLVVLLGLPAIAPAQSLPSAAAAAPSPIANPPALRASEILSRREPGVASRVLFEWDQVPGAREYVLQGRWIDPTTWGLHAREYRVGSRNAAGWTTERVSFDVSLPPGAHSWAVVAVFGPDEIGDFAHPTHVSFDLQASR